MWLTVEQVARLLNAPRDEAVQALSALEDEGLLLRWANGSYRRASMLLS
jgi:predicted transcriptional regulator of viral defense system